MTVQGVAARIHKGLKVTHLTWILDRYLVGYWVRHNDIPRGVGTEPGYFICPACKRKFISARPVRDSLLDHLNECDQT